jgi:hypothetical protein
MIRELSIFLQKKEFTAYTPRIPNKKCGALKKGVFLAEI